MKNFYRLTVCAAIMLLAACSENDGDNSYLNVSPATETIAFSADAAETFSFTVETNQAAWNVDSNQSWCTATKTADGKGFVVTARPNGSTAAPEAAVITVTAGNASPVTITATQQAVPSYDVTTTTNDHGSIESISELTSLQEGAEVRLTAVPDNGYIFSHWEIESDATIAFDPKYNPLVFFMPAANVAVKAEFISQDELPHLTITTPWGDEGGTMNFFFAGSGQAMIDWGDGSQIETVALSPLTDWGTTSSANTVEHTFIAGAGEKNIKIFGTVTGVGTGMTGTATAVDASRMPTLEYLDCRLENLTTLNVSGCSSLKMIHSYGNNLSSIDVSDCTALVRLYVSGNRLTALDISHNPNLDMVACDKNNLTRAALLDIFKALPDRSGKDLPEGELYCGGYDNPNPGYAELTDEDRKICADKNWWPYNGWF